MTQDITNYVHNCHFCKVRKADNRRAKIPIQAYTTSTRPQDRGHLDATGPFPITERGNRYLLVYKDALTKWITIIPTPNKLAVTVLKALMAHVFNIIGTCRLLITDQGKEFDNKDMDELTRLLASNHVRTTAYNPRSDGLAENAMRTVKDMLASFTNKFHTNWDLFSTQIAYQYNTTVNLATGYTPFYLMFGRMHVEAGDVPFEEPIPKDVNEYIHDMVAVMQYIRQAVGERVTDNVFVMNKRPTYRLEFKPFKVGDYFLLRMHPKREFKNTNEELVYKLSSKLQDRWEGPYKILKVITPILYDADVHNTVRRVHAVNMRDY